MSKTNFDTLFKHINEWYPKQDPIHEIVRSIMVELSTKKVPLTNEQEALFKELDIAVMTKVHLRNMVRIIWNNGERSYMNHLSRELRNNCVCRFCGTDFENDR